MHLATAFIVLYFIWRKNLWKHWETFHPTLLYFGLCNLLYHFLTGNDFLWAFRYDMWTPSYYLTEIIYTFIIFPGTALFFLYYFPQKHSRQLRHILIWVAIYVAWEWVFGLTYRMEYRHGWNLLWSAAFDCIMFPMLYLHYRRPLVTYLLSVPITLFFLWFFDVPIK